MTNSIVLLLIFINIINAQNISECYKCGLSDSCNLAYNNSPGQFCHFIDTSTFNACCCPVDSVCVNSINSCNCRPLTSHQKHSIYVSMGIMFSVMLVLIGYLCLKKKKYTEPPINRYTVSNLTRSQPAPINVITLTNTTRPAKQDDDDYMISF